jgi:hypothetical protein
MNVSSFNRFMRFFSVTNSWALMDLISDPVPLISPVAAGVSWPVVAAWVAVGFWGWVPWVLLSLLAQELGGHLLFVLSFLWLHRCWHVPIHTFLWIVLGL